MEPKSATEILLSPQGLIILPFFAVIDAIGIALVCFALDDFWITDIIAWGSYGLWSAFRWKTKPTEIQTQTPSIGAKKEWTREAGLSEKAGKSAKWAKRLKFLEFIPYVGALPLWTISVYMEMKYS